MDLKPFYESIKDFICGIDEKGLTILELAHSNNVHRILIGLYLIQTTKIPEKEKPGMMEFVKGVIEKYPSNQDIKKSAKKIFAIIVLGKSP